MIYCGYGLVFKRFAICRVNCLFRCNWSRLHWQSTIQRHFSIQIFGKIAFKPLEFNIVLLRIIIKFVVSICTIFALYVSRTAPDHLVSMRISRLFSKCHKIETQCKAYFQNGHYNSDKSNSSGNFPITFNKKCGNEEISNILYVIYFICVSSNTLYFLWLLGNCSFLFWKSFPFFCCYTPNWFFLFVRWSFWFDIYQINTGE